MGYTCIIQCTTTNNVGGTTVRESMDSSSTNGGIPVLNSVLLIIMLAVQLYVSQWLVVALTVVYMYYTAN